METSSASSSTQHKNNILDMFNLTAILFTRAREFQKEPND